MTSGRGGAPDPTASRQFVAPLYLCFQPPSVRLDRHGEQPAGRRDRRSVTRDQLGDELVCHLRREGLRHPLPRLVVSSGTGPCSSTTLKGGPDQMSTLTRLGLGRRVWDTPGRPMGHCGRVRWRDWGVIRPPGRARRVTQPSPPRSVRSHGRAVRRPPRLCLIRAWNRRGSAQKVLCARFRVRRLRRQQPRRP